MAAGNYGNTKARWRAAMAQKSKAHKSPDDNEEFPFRHGRPARKPSSTRTTTSVGTPGFFLFEKRADKEGSNRAA